MSVGRFLLTLLIAYAAFWMFFGVIKLFIFPDVIKGYMAVMRPEGSLLLFEHVGRLVQTLVIVGIYNYFVAQRSWKKGAIVGLYFGAFLSGCALVNYALLPITQGVLILSICSYLIVLPIVGGIIGNLYKKG